MEEKFFMNSECLTEKQILDYKANNLSKEELRKIEKHLIDCPFCSDAMEGAERLDINSIENDILFVKKKIESRTKKRTPKTFIYSAVAALLLISITAIFNISQHSDTEKLFNNYFEVYPDVTVHKRSSGSNSELVAAMNFYNQKQYKKASEIFTKIIKSSNNETAVFYNGISLMKLKQMNNALADFLKISADTKSNFYAEANWYAALSLIYLGKPKDAKTYLLRLNTNIDYNKKANVILKQLTNSD